MSTIEREPVSKTRANERRTLWSDIERLGKSKAVRQIGALALAIPASIYVGAQLGEAYGPSYDFSDETKKVTVEQGDTTWSLIEENLDTTGIDTREIVEHVMNDPINSDVFDDGILIPGKKLALPESVSE